MENIFADHDVDPSQKDEKWIRDACTNIWRDNENTSTKIFYKIKPQYDINDSYVQGLQSIEKYKPAQGVDPKATSSWRVVDWTQRRVLAKVIDILESKVTNRGYYVSATPVDPAAKSAADKYFTDIKVKMMMREVAKQSGIDPDSHPALQRQPGEPKNQEELKQQMNYSYVFNLAMQTEKGIQLVQQQNNFKQLRKEYNSNIIRHGVGILKEDVDGNGDIVMRVCHAGSMVVSECVKQDFSDKRYVGELSSVPLSYLSRYFGENDLKRIADQAKRVDYDIQSAGTRMIQNRDKANVQVFDLEFKSWNKKSWKQHYTTYGNHRIKETTRIATKEEESTTFRYNGQELPRFITKSQEVIYKAKWVVGTEYIYDYGIAKNDKRSAPNRGLTDFSYHIYAPHYLNGIAMSYVDRTIPIIDEYQNTALKIQNFKSEWIPYVIDIDFAAIEALPLGQGGKNLDLKEVLELLYSKYILPNRRDPLNAQGVNYKPIEIHSTNMDQAFVVLVSDMVRLLNELRDVVGLNELTDASTPNSNTLNGVAAIGVESTNNALKPLYDADEFIVQSSSQGIVRRLKHVVKAKKIAGLLPALGENTVQFFELTPDISLHDWGIFLQPLPSAAEKELFMSKLQLADQNGQINPEDYVIIMNCTNLKQAAQMLADSINRRQQQQHEMAIQLQQINGQVQQQSAQVSEQAKQKTNYELHMYTLEEIKAKGDQDRETLTLKQKGEHEVAEMTGGLKFTSDLMKNQQQADQAAQKQQAA